MENIKTIAKGDKLNKKKRIDKKHTKLQDT